jgi:hypothetical protein
MLDSQTTAPDEEQSSSLPVLLVDEGQCGASTGGVLAHTSAA